tara:strand:- start:406 stop:717 length:312 start_codon:yes stop_codon:yes gene_type:complete
MSSWTDHVKAYAAKNKVSYKDALKSAGATYTKTSKPKESKAHEAKEAKMPAKKKKKEEKKEEEMPELAGKAEKRDKLVAKYEKEKSIKEAEVKIKKKPTLLMK